jgi:hypothetical protein
LRSSTGTAACSSAAKPPIVRVRIGPSPAPARGRAESSTTFRLTGFRTLGARAFPTAAR